MSHVPCHMSLRNAFTILELLVVIAVITVVSIISFMLFSGRHSSTDLTSTEQQMVAVIRDAQNRSVTQYQGVSWGVYFSNVTGTPPFYALFFSSYAPTTTVARYPLASSVAYVTSTLTVGSTLTITFNGISGAASASTSIGLHSLSQPSLPSSTIYIASSGAVSF
jgi:prepilin-type N-terminal cleavage/methylation domain-containing protein